MRISNIRTCFLSKYKLYWQQQKKECVHVRTSDQCFTKTLQKTVHSPGRHTLLYLHAQQKPGGLWDQAGELTLADSQLCVQIDLHMGRVPQMFVRSPETYLSSSLQKVRFQQLKTSVVLKNRWEKQKIPEQPTRNWIKGRNKQVSLLSRANCAEGADGLL